MSDACFTQKQGWCLAGPEPLSHETKHLTATLLAKRRRCRGNERESGPSWEPRRKRPCSRVALKVAKIQLDRKG